MKRYLSIVAFMAMMAISAGCEEFGFENGDELLDGPSITLNLSTPGADDVNVDTKAAGVTELNENLITSVIYAIWPDDATDEAPVVYGTVPDLSSQLTETIRVGLDESNVDRLFPNQIRTCTAFVIANYPGTISTLSGETLEHIKTLAVTANLQKPECQDSFVMTFEGAVNLDSKRKKVVATSDVELERLAAKITLNAKINETYTDETTGKTWTPMVSSMKMKLYYRTGSAVLGADYDAGTDGIYSTEDYASFTSTGYDSTNKQYVSTSAPYYSYPREWKHGASNEPYVLIALPWSDGASQTTFFYKVILTGSSFDRNTWHTINLHIGILGSLDENRPTVVTSDQLYYYVYDWNVSIIGSQGSGSSQGDDVEAVVPDARYLVVAKNTYVINNLEDLQIPFGTSHNCVIADDTGSVTATIKATKPDYTSKTSIGTTEVDASSWLTVNNDTKMVEFHHDIINDMTSTGSNGKKNYDVAPYTITFRIQHSDNANYYEELTIIQYPAIYITAEVSAYDETTGEYYSNSGRNDDGSFKSGKGYCGTMYVNGYQGSSDPFGGCNGIGNNQNQNPYMYIITTTVLPDASSYIIADPRLTGDSDSNKYDNLSGWGDSGKTELTSAPSIDGTGSRVLKYYRPAITVSGGENFLAPKFRIASSYGGTAAISFTDAQKRCATYQEQGRPAGRWRLPSLSEIKFMCQLTTDGYIPRLLGNDDDDYTDYWAGNGYARVYGSSTTPPLGVVGTYSSTRYVRCVYDEWYWAESQYPRTTDNKVFTWGDQPY